MKKLTDKFTLRGIQAKLRETKISLERINDYQEMGHSCSDLLDMYTEDLKKIENVLSQYRQDLTLLRSNKPVKYSK